MNIKQPFTVRLLIVAVALMGTFCSNGTSDNGFCPRVYQAGVFGPLSFTPAFTTIDTFNDSGGTARDDLLISSFFNSIKDIDGDNVIGFFEDDLIARIKGIGQVKPSTFDPNTDVERLTDLGGGTPRTVWPNSVDRVPDGIISFEAVVIPGGFQATPPPGRLSIIDLDDPNRQEYIVDQSTQLPGPPCPFPPDPANAPRFYHQVKYADMDQDGLKDLVTVRSGFKVVGGLCVPPVGEVVWFRNPGAALDPDTEWDENVIVGFPSDPLAADLNHDGRVDVLATNHQEDDCFNVTQNPIPGRVFAAEQPASGDIFNDDWTVHILKDNIRPNPTFPKPSMGPGRLAPGRATAFWPDRSMEGTLKPWIAVAGDEASKVWLLQPIDQNPNRWQYRSAVLFDINDYYGPNTSQMLTAPPPGQGNSISTVGGMSVRYDRPDDLGKAEIYVSVFEARDIHKFSFRDQGPGTWVDCIEDVQIACPSAE